MRILAGAQEERARALRQDRIALDDAVRERPDRHDDRLQDGLARSGSAKPQNCKQLLAYVIEDRNLLLKFAAEEKPGSTSASKVGKPRPLTDPEPKIFCATGEDPTRVWSSWWNSLLENHICAEIADILNAKGIRPGGSARRDRQARSLRSPRDLLVKTVWGCRSATIDCGIGAC